MGNVVAIVSDILIYLFRQGKRWPTLTALTVEKRVRNLHYNDNELNYQPK